jgi:hypothetical protein
MNVVMSLQSLDEFDEDCLLSSLALKDVRVPFCNISCFDVINIDFGGTFTYFHEGSLDNLCSGGGHGGTNSIYEFIVLESAVSICIE